MSEQPHGVHFIPILPTSFGSRRKVPSSQIDILFLPSTLRTVTMASGSSEWVDAVTQSASVANDRLSEWAASVSLKLKAAAEQDLDKLTSTQGQSQYAM